MLEVRRCWTTWTEVLTFEVPAEDWNTDERADAAYLCDARDLDGHWHLFYASSVETDTFRGRGHAAIGVARSNDLGDEVSMRSWATAAAKTRESPRR